MKTLQRLAVVIFVFCGVFANAQTYKTTNSNVEGFQDKTSERDFLSSQKTASLFTKAAPSDNNVFINQIGSGNNAVIDTKSNSSNLGITQNGSDNDIYYQVSAATIEGTILQNGDNNSIFHSNPFDLERQQAQILQNGNNQNIEWFGGNSVSERMKIKMQGENQSIIIRSFN
jgi:hypothetical protein